MDLTKDPLQSEATPIPRKKLNRKSFIKNDSNYRNDDTGLECFSRSPFNPERNIDKDTSYAATNFDNSTTNMFNEIHTPPGPSSRSVCRKSVKTKTKATQRGNNKNNKSIGPIDKIQPSKPLNAQFSLCASPEVNQKLRRTHPKEKNNGGSMVPRRKVVRQKRESLLDKKIDTNREVIAIDDSGADRNRANRENPRKTKAPDHDNENGDSYRKNEDPEKVVENLESDGDTIKQRQRQHQQGKQNRFSCPMVSRPITSEDEMISKSSQIKNHGTQGEENTILDKGFTRFNGSGGPTTHLNKNGKRRKSSKGGTGKRILPGCSFGKSDDIDEFSDSTSEYRRTNKNRRKSDHQTPVSKVFDKIETCITRPCKETFRSMKKQIYGGVKVSYNGIYMPGTKNNEDDEYYPYQGKNGSSHRKSSRLSKIHKNKNEGVIDLIESSSEEEDEITPQNNSQTVMLELTPTIPKKRGFGDLMKITAARIAVGKKLFSAHCEMTIQPGGCTQCIMLKYVNKKPMDGKKYEYKEEIKKILVDDITEMRYHLINEESDDAATTNADNDDSQDAMNFIAMRVNPTKENGLDTITSSYEQSYDISGSDAPSANSEKKWYIVVEFRRAEDFKAQRDTILQNEGSPLKIYLEEPPLPIEDVPKYASVLISDNKRERRRRMLSSPGRALKSRRVTKGDSSASANKRLLVFPFPTSEDIVDNAAKGLTEASGVFCKGDSSGTELTEKEANPDDSCWNSKENKPDAESQVAKSVHTENESGKDSEHNRNSDPSGGSTGRTHYLTICAEDFERLDDGEFLNDTLIDFWMRWIWRKENQVTSSVHFFTSHFFTTLQEDPLSVSSWTAKKNIDIFKKKFIFIPINESLHWSLCTVVNPGDIKNAHYRTDQEGNLSDNLPCLLFMDSLKAHRKNKIAIDVRRWLNSEWKRLRCGGETASEMAKPFNLKTMVVYDPKIPYQDNSWDCGVFVCRYAFALYQQRNEPFTYKDIQKKHQLFADTITNSKGFDFNMNDITRLRDEIKTLIINLSTLYLKEKAEKEEEKRKKKQAFKEEKKERKSQE